MTVTMCDLQEAPSDAFGSSRPAVHLPLSAPVNRSVHPHWGEPASPYTSKQAGEIDRTYVHGIQREAWARKFARPPTPPI